MSETERIEWRELLRDAFAVSGMSERAVSEQSKVNRGSLSGVLGGRSVPRASTIDALRRVFDLDADLTKARREVADRRARPGATPSIYWVPEAGSPEADEPVTWGHMEDRFAELDARIARLEQAVIRLSNLTDLSDPKAQVAVIARIKRQHEERAKSDPSATTAQDDVALVAHELERSIQAEQEAHNRT